ncbi:MAG: glycosyltransferase [Clostridia bacterium]|nr:glycosyltransferase [Clostridia bacterium]
MDISKPLISLCMIVKNEEENIARCLESIKSYVDEILILDTGSTDQTPKIAKKLGAVVSFGTWENDFSRARNESIKAAKGKWILILDADEEVPEETGRALRELAEKEEAEAYIFNIVNYTTKDKDCQKQIGLNLRMFRNNPLYTFQGKIHEQIKGNILKANPGAKIIHSGLNIIHYGYCSDNKKRKEKNLRNIELLKEALAENPRDAFLHYNLGVSYYVNGRLEKAIEHYQRAKQLTGTKAFFRPVLFRNFAICLFDLTRYEEALNLLNEGLSYYPDYPDLYYLKGQIYFALRLVNHAQECFENCLKFTRVKPEYVSTQGINGFLSYEYLADIYGYKNNWPKATEYQLLAVKNGAKSYTSAHRLAVFAARSFQNKRDLSVFLKENLHHLTRENKTNILFNAGCFNLVLEEFESGGENNHQDLLLAAKAQMHFKKWEKAQKYLDLIPANSENYQEAQILKYFCLCLKDQSSEQKLLKPDFSIRAVINTNPEIIYQLLLFDKERTLSICKNILNSSADLNLLLSKLGKIALKTGNLNLAESLFLSNLSSSHHSPEIYRLLGETYISMGEKTEGLYFLCQAVLMEPNKSENYLCLLKHVVDYFAERIREIFRIYPHWGLITHHLCALTTFRTKLDGKEVSS